MKNALVLIGFVVLCLAAGGLGGWWTAGAVRDWYPTITKPSWTPPSWLFGPVWTLLYIMMGVAAFLVWRTRSRLRRTALTLFAIQLLLNTLWSAIFFGQRQIGWAAVEIVALWVAIVMTTVAFWRVSRPAGGLMLPYLAWVTYATALNIAIWRLNAT